MILCVRETSPTPSNAACSNILSQFKQYRRRNNLFNAFHLQFGRDYSPQQSRQDDFRKCNQTGRTSGCIVMFFPTKNMQIYITDHDPVGAVHDTFHQIQSFAERDTNNALIRQPLYWSLAAIDMSA